uniref:Uncharacterized protein n=1 Tax=uncultured alpha proteobacterium HF0130_06E21 TaxID=710808 RepID=E0XT08_9PROT|nr:hypothetical protein [uncultured alpha proteobacterium HF0130_06E21]
MARGANDRRLGDSGHERASRRRSILCTGPHVHWASVLIFTPARFPAYPAGMKALTAIIIAIGLCFAATGASAQYFDSRHLSKVEAIEVAVEGEVSDACLDNLVPLRTEAELALRRSGIKFVDDATHRELAKRRRYGIKIEGADAPHRLLMDVIGYEITDGCVATIAMRVQSQEWLADQTFGAAEAWYQLGLISGPKASFAQQLSERVDAMVTALANEIPI